MERTIGGFGFADLYAGTRRRNPNFLDAVEELIDWSRIEQKLRKKLRRFADKRGTKVIAARLIVTTFARAK